MNAVLNFRNVEPVEFILSEREGFLHKFKGCAVLLSQNKSDELKSRALGKNLAHEVNNYRLPISTFHGKMPDVASELGLGLLRGYMDILWEQRQTLRTDALIPLADEIIFQYESLVNHLKEVSYK